MSVASRVGCQKNISIRDEDEMKKERGEIKSRGKELANENAREEEPTMRQVPILRRHSIKMLSGSTRWS